MSLLAPLYFLGALAVGLPIVFHLIRRRPKGEVEFSSLMFLKPTPPRLTRRSRLENLPLLLIRALALIFEQDRHGDVGEIFTFLEGIGRKPRV